MNSEKKRVKTLYSITFNNEFKLHNLANLCKSAINLEFKNLNNSISLKYDFIKITYKQTESWVKLQNCPLNEEIIVHLDKKLHMTQRKKPLPCPHDLFTLIYTDQNKKTGNWQDEKNLHYFVIKIYSTQ